MSHRTTVVALHSQAGYQETLEMAVHEKYTRLPVYEDPIDDIICILHLKDLLSFVADGQDRPFDLKALIRPPYFVPESKKVDVLFQEMQRARAHGCRLMSTAVQPVSLLLRICSEEIVGNIQDEYDEEEQDIIQKDEQTYIVNGMTTLDELGDRVNVEFLKEILIHWRVWSSVFSVGYPKKEKP